MNASKRPKILLNPPLAKEEVLCEHTANMAYGEFQQTLRAKTVDCQPMRVATASGDLKRPRQQLKSGLTN